MSGHVALPAITGDPALPATLSVAVMHDLLRAELGFEGLAISDALDMRALPQGPEQALDAVVSLRAGLDLLLLTPDPAAQQRIETAVAHAASRGLIERPAVARSLERLARLQSRLAGIPAPSLGVVGSAEHRRLADELAERSSTLVRKRRRTAAHSPWPRRADRRRDAATVGSHARRYLVTRAAHARSRPPGAPSGRRRVRHLERPDSRRDLGGARPGSRP